MAITQKWWRNLFTVLVLQCITVTISTSCSFGALNDPFPMGYSMANFGTILMSDGISGRQPWTSAAYLGSSAGFGFSTAATDYYDNMDNYADRAIRQVSAGGWFAYRALVLKSAYTHFNALDIYREQQGFISAGVRLKRNIAASIDISGYQARLTVSTNARESVLLGAATVWIPWRYASVSVKADGIVLKDAYRPGFAPPFSCSIGLHSAPHRFGSQGVVVKIEPQNNMRICFFAGEEYWIQETLGIHAALSTNPLMVGFGAALRFRRATITSSFVNHPILGWSKGISGDFMREFSSMQSSGSSSVSARP